MHTVVAVKLVPDPVEELTVDPSGTALDAAWIRLIINEFDDQALEQAILLKERGAGQVTIVAPEAEGVDDVLYTAAAKGADRLVKLTGEAAGATNNHSLARALATAIKPLQPDLILTGVQAHDDLDGPVGPLLAEYLGLSYVGYVAGVKAGDGEAVVRKEYPDGLSAELEVKLPAVLGVQVAEQPPRYVAISKVRQAMQSASIESQAAVGSDTCGSPGVDRMFQPEATGRAAMIEGDAEKVAARLLEILRELGVL